MTIKEDSGNVLLYVYKNKIEGNEMPHPDLLLNETGWKNIIRLNNAVQYLMEKEFVNGTLIRDLPSKEEKLLTIKPTNIKYAVINDITHLGIDIVEDKPEFKNHFGISVNLGLIQINWGRQES